MQRGDTLAHRSPFLHTSSLAHSPLSFRLQRWESTLWTTSIEHMGKRVSPVLSPSPRQCILLSSQFSTFSTLFPNEQPQHSIGPWNSWHVDPHGVVWIWHVNLSFLFIEKPIYIPREFPSMQKLFPLRGGRCSSAKLALMEITLE